MTFIVASLSHSIFKNISKLVLIRMWNFIIVLIINANLNIENKAHPDRHSKKIIKVT